MSARLFLILLCLLLCLTPQVRASFDTVSTASSTSTTMTIGPFTIAANSNRALVVSLPFRGSGSIATVKWNTTESLTSVVSTTQSDIKVGIWRLLAPTTGSHSVDVTTNAVVDWMAGCAISLYDIDQTTPEEDTDSAVGTASTISMGALTSTSDLADFVDGLSTSGNSATMTAATGRVERMNTAISADVGACSTIIGRTPAGSSTMQWTTVVSDNHALVGVVFKPVAAAGGGGTS